MYHYGLIGNCQVSALISKRGSIDWLCLPRPDSPPVFGKLLDEQGGSFVIEPAGPYKSVQTYKLNTNVLVTEFFMDDGSSFTLTDFAPRFSLHGRMYRPNAIFRIVQPTQGNPKMVVKCEPVSGWDKKPVAPVRGNTHLNWEIRDEPLRLLTSMPLTYLAEHKEFVLKETIYFGLTWSFAIEEPLPQLVNRFLEQTEDYWRTWIKHCSIPPQYQKETIRSALALKLHCYEDTGAILAATTTSLPETPGKERNWDYRFCWLRDAYFVLSAFRNLGHFEEVEGFIKYLLSIISNHEFSKERLCPVYRLDQTVPMPEEIHDRWSGFLNSQPVRSGNQAAEHIQNDVYGEMLLTLLPIFADDRFFSLRTPEHEESIQYLIRKAVSNISRPDAGLWEFRSGWQEHTFSNLMIWAGLHRAQILSTNGYFTKPLQDLSKEIKSSYEAVLRSTKDGSLRNGPHDPSMDAALLQSAILRFPDRDLNLGTLNRVREKLAFSQDSAFLFRYLREDDFGRPELAFVICSFWLVQALVLNGKTDEARNLMDQAMSSSNELGLFSEHFDPIKKLQTGNFPQAYSHVGQINATFALSPRWDEIL